MRVYLGPTHATSLALVLTFSIVLEDFEDILRKEYRVIGLPYGLKEFL